MISADIRKSELCIGAGLSDPVKASIDDLKSKLARDRFSASDNYRCEDSGLKYAVFVAGRPSSVQRLPEKWLLSPAEIESLQASYTIGKSVVDIV